MRIINEGKRILFNSHQVILFGSVLKSNIFNDVDIICIYEKHKRLLILQEIELYSSIIFDITQVNLHAVLLNLEESKTSIFLKSVKQNKHYYMKGSNQILTLPLKYN
ncbi:hypothetical protein COMX_00225 [Commensalibacter papalotli (ex Servin-Garciduenas et al. 2014)]|uniref:Polymerase beta nucleotidyltransferase domain-containing protein n=1 Tax=Commensalibacter papalotli (ex Servin-Garciduenas et al. 2014) TaxID=1208583 RepID=W7DZP4_9PROT|nr:hypothetical protein COMX_00225 [Commensalibacter papalotli (ex Servin-Garciduenas et al. 2014)]